MLFERPILMDGKGVLVIITDDDNNKHLTNDGEHFIITSIGCYEHHVQVYCANNPPAD